MLKAAGMEWSLFPGGICYASQPSFPIFRFFGVQALSTFKERTAT